MDTGLLSLKWNNHSSTFFHVLETIRRKELYSDVTIACDGKFFSVHKLVLSTCSEYFQEMFERTQCKHPIIVLKDINHKDLESLLNYMYIGEVNVIQTELSSLIKAAECLKVKGLAVPDEPPPSTRKSSKRPSVSDRDEGSSHTKRNRRSGPPISSMQSQVQSASIIDDRVSSENVPTSPCINQESELPVVESHEKEKRLITEDHHQSPSHNYKDLETTIKVEKEDTSEGYVQDGLPPITKFEYDGSPIDNTMSSGLDESNESNYTSHLQQPPSSEDQMGHLIPSTSGYGESSNWPGEMEGMEEGEKEGGDGANYDPNALFLDNPQAKSQMALFRPQVVNILEHPVSNLTEQYMTREGSMWRCLFPGCFYQDYYKGHVITHVRKHTGEKPFMCSLCDYKSNQKSKVSRHFKNVHG